MHKGIYLQHVYICIYIQQGKFFFSPPLLLHLFIMTSLLNLFAIIIIKNQEIWLNDKIAFLVIIILCFPSDFKAHGRRTSQLFKNGKRNKRPKSGPFRKLVDLSSFSSKKGTLFYILQDVRFELKSVRPSN